MTEGAGLAPLCLRMAFADESLTTFKSGVTLPPSAAAGQNLADTSCRLPVHASVNSGTTGVFNVPLPRDGLADSAVRAPNRSNK